MASEHDKIVVLDEGREETLASLEACCKVGPARAVASQ
jgi:hypothetical protein